MSHSSNGVHREPHTDGLVHDVQGRWWEMLSAGQVLTGQEQQQQQPPMAAKARKSKCHGNRKLYHFKRKWRARGLDEQAIQALIEARQKGIDGPNNDDHMVPQGPIVEKRKRPQSMAASVQSLSQLSISQRSTKKRKEETTQDSSSSMEDTLSEVGKMSLRLDKYSKYLKMPIKLLLRSLRLQLDHRLKRKLECDYVLRRLHLLDEHYCVDRIRHLYQSYWDLGSKDQLWPVSMNSW